MSKGSIVLTIVLEDIKNINPCGAALYICPENMKSNFAANTALVTFKTKSEIPHKIIQAFDDFKLSDGSKVILLTEALISKSALTVIENYLNSYTLVNVNLIQSTFDKGFFALNDIKYYALFSKAAAFLSNLNLHDALSGIFGFRYLRAKIEPLKSVNFKSLSHLNLWFKKSYQRDGKYNLFELSHPEIFAKPPALLKEFFSWRSVADFFKMLLKTYRNGLERRERGSL